MSPVAAQILQSVRALPSAERAELAEAICLELDGSHLPPLHPTWQAEIDRRIAEHDAGLAKLIDWEEIEAEILEEERHG